MARHKVKNQWFVSVAVLKRGRIKAFDRRTETFLTETDAKQFAKEMLSKTEKRYIVAGTLRGGYLPVHRIISGSQLSSWVGALEPSPFKIRSRSDRRKPTDLVTPKPVRSSDIAAAD